MNFSESCDTYFGSKDLYEILKIPRSATQQEVRKAYHRLSLSCHPDRVSSEEKFEATEKFKVLAKVHSVLSDPEKRTIYDETGLIDGINEEQFQNHDWNEYWRSLFKTVCTSDISKYEEEYKGSELELQDLKETYIKCKGDYDKMFEYILFAKAEDEDRIRARLQKLIDDKELPEYEVFTNEPERKRERRMRKLKKEAKEVEKAEKAAKADKQVKVCKKETDSFLELQRAILGKEHKFVEELEKKYSNPKAKKGPKKAKKGPKNSGSPK